jgi:hypothetical protein
VIDVVVVVVDIIVVLVVVFVVVEVVLEEGEVVIPIQTAPKFNSNFSILLFTF